jgi:hypothetical protein
MSSPFSPLSGFPLSFYTGPLGRDNILPPTASGALLGLWPYQGRTVAQMKRAVLSRESAIGRKLDIVHIHWSAASGRCDSGPRHSAFTRGNERWIVRHGATLVISWAPGWSIDQINAGAADKCFVSFGRKAARFGRRFLLRPYWEFNGTWMLWSSKGQPFIDAWRRTVAKIREGGGTNVGFVWSPASGYQAEALTSYPGDDYVDWVGVSAYNWNRVGVWCSPYNPGPWCELRGILSYDAANYPTIYDHYSESKPFMVAEWGSAEDPFTLGRKRQWFLNIKKKIPTELPRVRALSYFDVDRTALENINWQLQTSQSSLAGFRRLALEPFFNPRDR